MLSHCSGRQRAREAVRASLRCRMKVSPIPAAPFRHLQRLSLDFFTEEKAGVVMSRMTSDIENLQQLLQDGLSQLAIQGLTMVVITAILFTINVQLAFITVVLVIPVNPLVGRFRLTAGARRSSSRSASNA